MNDVTINLPISFSNLSGEQTQVVDFKLLHQVLGPKTPALKWLYRAIARYGFVEGVDYEVVTLDPTNIENWPAIKSNGSNTRLTTLISLDMAKELCMVDATDIGRKTRQYFILAEKIAVKHAKQEMLNAIAQKQEQVDNHKRMLDTSEVDCMTLAKKQGYNSISLALHGAQKSEDRYKAVMNINGLKCQSELGRVTVNRIEDLLQSVKKDLPEPMATRLERTFRVYNEEMEKDVPAVNPY